MHKVIKLISNFLYNKNMPPSMKVHVHYMNLMKNQIIQKFQSLEILKEMATRKRTHFFNHLTKKMCLIGSKMSSLKCKSHVQEIILWKKHVWLSIETQFGNFYVSSYKPKYLCTIMYECENSPPPPHELS